MKQGLKLAGRAIGTYILTLFLCLLILPGITGEWLWAQMALNGLLLVAMGMLMYADGGAQGERAATMSATVAHMRQEGRPVEGMLERCFTVRAAVICYAAILLPLLVVAGANLVAEPFYPPVIVEPIDAAEEAALYEAALMQEANEVAMPEATPTSPAEEGGQADASDEPGGETPAEPVRAANPFNVVARVVFMPLLSIYQLFGDNPHGLNLIFLAFALIAPLPEALGYMMGPSLRRKKLDAIQKGKRKKRRASANKKQQAPREPKHEV